jgi:alkylhydroperoxidase/carboxymuconolactone decarboxylase family protein YurZ
MPATNAGGLGAQEVMERFIAERGDLFEEFHLMAAAIPDTVNFIRATAGYVHFYENQTAPDQELSGQMRELIATCQLCAKNDDRFAPNHVRRLYRMGVTNRVIFEAAASIAPIVGWSTIAHVAQAILTANKPDYPYGTLPPGGEPRSLTPFPDLELGHVLKRPLSDSLLDTPEWRYVAKIDPELARRGSAFVDHCLLAHGAGDALLGPGARELIAIAALCARGEVEIAAHHIRRAYAYGVSRRQVLEAISCVLPMTGALTVQIGARAMRLADRTGGGRRKGSRFRAPTRRSRTRKQARGR